MEPLWRAGRGHERRGPSPAGDSIQAHYRAQMPSFTPGSPPDSATREKIRGLFRHELNDIRAVLTADQQKAFDQNVAEMREGRRGGP